MVMTIDDMDIPRKPSTMTPMRARSPSRPPPPEIKDDDSSTLSGEGDDSKMPMTIDEMDIPRKPSAASPSRPRQPLVPLADSDDSSTLPAAEGEDTYEPAGRGESKMIMTIDDMAIPRKPSSSPPRQPLVPLADSDDSSTLPAAEGEDTYEPAGRGDSKMIMTIDDRAIPRKPSSSPPRKQLVPLADSDDSSTLPAAEGEDTYEPAGRGDSKMTMTIDDMAIPRKPSSNTPMRPLAPPRALPLPQLSDDDSSTLPEEEPKRVMTIDDMTIPRKPSSMPSMSPTRARSRSPARPRTPPQMKDDDSSTLPGEGEDTFEIPNNEGEYKIAQKIQPQNKKAGRGLVSFSLSGGPLFSPKSRKYMEKIHDPTNDDDVSSLEESNRSLGFDMSDDFPIPAVRGNTTGLAAQAVPLRRSQLEDEENGALGEVGDTFDMEDVKPAKKRGFNLRGNRRVSRMGIGNKSPKKSPKNSRSPKNSPKKSPSKVDSANGDFVARMTSAELKARRKELEYGDDSSTMGGLGDTLELVETEPKKKRVFNLRGNKRVSLLGGFGKSNNGSSDDDDDEEETDEFNLAPLTAEAMSRRRKELEYGDDSSTVGGEGDTLEPVEAKPKRGMSKMVSFSMSSGPASLIGKLSPKRNKKTLGGLKEGVSDDESDDLLGGLSSKSRTISHSGVNMAGGIGVGKVPNSPMVPPSPIQVSRRRKPRRRVKRGGMVTTPSSMNLGEVMSNPFTTEDMEEVNRAQSRRGSVSSVVSASELSQETDLHKALADEDATMEQLNYLLQNEPAAASIHDHDGKLPLHIVAENEQLHLNLGQALDDFILEDLIHRNRRALITTNYAGEFPFVGGIREWVDNINEVAENNIPDLSTFESKKAESPKPMGGRRRMSLLGAFGAGPKEPDSDDSSELALVAPNNDVEDPAKKEEILRDLAEHLIPWNVFIDDLALWSIDMLSMLIEREPLKAMWTIKIVDTVASIPCFLKTVLLIDDDEQRKHVLQSRLLHEVMLHEKSMGPWLVYLITSDDEVAQDRAVMYLQLMTVIEGKMAAAHRSTFSTRLSGAFKSADNQFFERKNKVYTKAAELPGIIPSFMQFNSSNFSKCSTSSIVQFILDKKLFEPKSLTVILFDVFFLTMAVVLFTLCSNEVFKLISNMRYSPMLTFAVNQTAYNLCEDGTLGRDDHTCLYYNEKQANGDPFNIGSVSLFRPTFDCDLECQICKGLGNFEGDATKGGSIIEYSGEEALSEEFLFTCYAIGDRYPIDTFLIFCVMALSFNCLYFMSRSLAAWGRVPRKYLAAQFFFVFTVVDTVSIIFPVVLVIIFLLFIYQTDKYTGIGDGNYVPLKIYEVWMYEAEWLSAASAGCVGFLYLKILMYFKVLNQYTATFIFALGEVVKDIFWFFWIMVVIIFAFSQMFYTTLSCKEGFCKADFGQSESPYNFFSDSLLITYSILLGEFDLEQYNSPFTTILFVLYTFGIVIVVLNFLIAIVGDSFDKSMIKIESHFGRARLMFMVELSAFQSYAKVPFRVKKQNYRRFLLGGNWKGCISYIILSAGLVSGFVLLIINKDLVTKSSTPVIAMIGVTLGLMILSPFIWKLGLVRFLVHSSLLSPVRRGVGKLLIMFFRVILGKSILSERSEKDQKDWGGRLKHIVGAIDEKIRESEALTLSTIAENDERQNRIIEKMELRMENLEEDVSDMKKMLIKIQKMLEEQG
ncbi:unnamed protein product [Cylindrotheca closterium]|uniref:Ion transport domain-containing protein n=1 Tax=Cylindrotheca closterium TaxID=2856 RepID=A0AAD2FHU3_9STRA|nr:unnamed protein product [Cylindrotheca closterium]